MLPVRSLALIFIFINTVLAKLNQLLEERRAGVTTRGEEARVSHEARMGELRQAADQSRRAAQAVLDQGFADLDRTATRVVAKSRTVDWVDPFVGARVQHQLAPGQEIEVRGARVRPRDVLLQSLHPPRSHDGLFREVISRGALISEQPPGVRAAKGHFLNRNRIIAGLSMGTIVVEAAYKSGAIRTARDSAELFRPVLALPGPITSPQSCGTHNLIRDRIAELVTSPLEARELLMRELASG